MTPKEHAQESWEMEGIRHLEEGRCPTPQERYIFGYVNGVMDTVFRALIPQDTHIAAVEIPEDEIE